MRRIFVTAAVALAATVGAAPALRAQPVRITFSEYACSDPSQPCEYQATTGRATSSQGFDFLDRSDVNGGGGTNSLGTWSNNPSNLGYRNRASNLNGSTALFAPGNGDIVEMYTSTGQNFGVSSMDVGALFRQSSITPPLGAPNTFNLYFQYYRSYNSFYNGTPDGDFSVTVPQVPLVGGDRVPFLYTVDFTGFNMNALQVNMLDGSQSDLRNVFGLTWVQGSLSGFDANGNPTFTQASGRAHQFTNIVAQVVPEPGTFALAAGGLLVVLGAGLRRRQA